MPKGWGLGWAWERSSGGGGGAPLPRRAPACRGHQQPCRAARGRRLKFRLACPWLTAPGCRQEGGPRNPPCSLMSGERAMVAGLPVGGSGEDGLQKQDCVRGGQQERITSNRKQGAGLSSSAGALARALAALRNPVRPRCPPSGLPAGCSQRAGAAAAAMLPQSQARLGRACRWQPRCGPGCPPVGRTRPRSHAPPPLVHAPP